MHSSIDIGSNTVRMLVAQHRNGHLVSLARHQQMTRLAGEVGADGLLHPTAMARTLSVLKHFHHLLPSGCRPPRVAGTAALRRAPNRAEFTRNLRRLTGWEMEILSGADEARLSVCGAINVLDPVPEKTLFFDLGGASLELVLLRGKEQLWRRSYPVGVVTLAESGQGSQLLGVLLKGVTKDLTDQFNRHGIEPATPELVGTAGTVTTLAALHLRLSPYIPDKVNNLTLPIQALTALKKIFRQSSPCQIKKLPGMDPGREDLILPGLEVVLGLIDLCGRRPLRAVDAGLLEGLLLERGDV